MGHVLGYSAVLIPKLKVERNVTDAEASAIASVSNLGQLVAVLAIGPLAANFGRVRVIAAFNALTALGFMSVALSQGSSWAILAGRTIQGCGIICSVAQVYIAEIATPELRSALGAAGACAISAGLALSHVAGAFVASWRADAWLCAFTPAVTSLLFLTVCPESPAWLTLTGRAHEAEYVLHK